MKGETATPIDASPRSVRSPKTTRSRSEWTQEQEAPARYGAWSACYDDPRNPIVALEQPAVWSLLERTAPGAALDVGCGSGRHSRRLVELGHDVVGIDVTPEMLSLARRNVPQATFIEAEMREMPVGDERFNLVVCGLALSHLRDLAAGIGELVGRWRRSL